MKNIILIFILSIFSAQICAQDHHHYDEDYGSKLLSPIYLTKKEKNKFSKLIEKIGLIKYADLEGKSKTDFWNYIKKNNLRLNKFLDACNKETKMAVNTLKEVTAGVNQSILARRELELSRVEEYKEDIISIENSYEYFLVGDGVSVNVKILDDESINAFAFPDGYIGINAGLVLSDLFVLDEKLYFLAHECAHYYLDHTYVHIYNQKRNKFKMDVVAGVSTAVVAGANFYVAAQNVYDGVPPVVDYDISDSVKEIIEGSKEIANKMSLKFSREEEFEADTYAMYYLMTQNISPLYTMNSIIKYIREFGDEPTDKNSTHPSWEERMKFLYYVLTVYNAINIQCYIK